jgi:hypothetical protein
LSNAITTTTYYLTDQDVDAYLASKHDDEVIGICAAPSDCLISWAVKAKYPDVQQVEVYNHTIFITTTTGAAHVALTPQQHKMLESFDYGTQARFTKPVTKEDFLAAWQRVTGLPERKSA